MTEKTAGAVRKMIEFYSRTSKVKVHDINHFMKVWGFARTIGISENLDGKTQETLELAAVAHDIACPLCREKYGNTDGKYQEQEGGPLTEAFYSDFNLPREQLNRICYLVSHHHTYTGVDGMDYQILLEADFLVNADESAMPKRAIRNFRERVFRTESGIRLLTEMYLPER
ncbi:MAG: HD domain-containing protein [Eubacteriales bacterium]|nr:HD domain-containing protein [Eubacteriales bacterium]